MKNRSIVLVVLVPVAAVMAMFIFVSLFGKSEVRVLHPDLVYTVGTVGPYDNEVTCVSDSFSLFLFGEVKAHACLKRANLPDGVKTGDRIAVYWQPARDDSRLRGKIHKL
jgi:hypothetical protein